MNEEIKIESVKDKKSKKAKKPKNDKTPRTGKFNFLDAVIILCVVFVALLVLYVYSPSDIFDLRANETNIIYVIRVSGVPEDYAGALNVGDVVSDTEGYILGAVASNVEVEPCVNYEYVENADGSGGIVPVTHPDLVDLLITISATAEFNDDGFSVGGKRIAVESEIGISLPRFQSKGICVSLSEEKANEAGVK